MNIPDFRRRLARRRYRRCLRALRAAATSSRAAILEQMAVHADQSGPDPDWLIRADISRYVAHATRGWVPAGISDEGGLLGPRYRNEWEDLAKAAAAGNRDMTANILGGLSAVPGIAPAAAELLWVIARTEIAVAGAGESR